MKWSLNLIFLVCCIWLNVSNNQVKGEIDEQCKVDCACCIDRKCGKGLWSSTDCTLGCIDGHRGFRCYELCTHNCTKCSVDANTCTECYDGYYPGAAGDCTSRCLPGCKTCKSGITCTSCKEGYNNAVGQNDCSIRNCPDNCNCYNGQCVSCLDGYYDISRSCNSLCPSYCVTCSSNTDCGSCRDGYYNGYQNDNIYHPFLNDCTSKCRNNCVQCSSYKKCSICKTGRYGSNCENSCSAGCRSNTCNILTGNCACFPNFAGVRCDKCNTGKYGKMCEQQCPAWCKDNVCEKDSGDCTDGCTIDTITGDKCDVCSTGWYGHYCNMSCSVGCKNQQCEKSNGECSNGCLDNFIGEQCNQCIHGKYGDTCQRNCPNNCDEKGCLKDSGYCISCRVNFHGEKCDKCRPGSFGSLCSERCPSNCLNHVCDRDSGTCSDGCINNYSGDRCCINNNNCIACLSDTRCKQCKSGYFNGQCDKQCPQNCLKSCHFETGLCGGCKSNFYGESCNCACASTCKIQTTANGSICQQSNGKCLYGCIDGLHGSQCTEKCSVYCNDILCIQDDGKCTKGCKTRVKNDHICPLVTDSRSSEQSVNIAAISLGTILVVSVVVNIIFVVTLILWKYRKRVNDTHKTKEPAYENSGIELECGNLENAGSASKHGIVQATKSDTVLKSSDYEDLGRVQVSEHEYGEIRTDT
ncbi:multiple epidermal growth factor-like domains protein 10 [Ruditapes philippinarum]|uniref:multiple epidermal growth factor-like domains protein 10 n=1 Tax=Ruditapes philippinarum TaxID=129788 RepID=UPI00295B0820|nr:multiple epidermal growth factor-like domains protein 10 [Ruditapes philippinarum]